jgi:hypothetical protein
MSWVHALVVSEQFSGYTAKGGFLYGVRNSLKRFLKGIASFFKEAIKILALDFRNNKNTTKCKTIGAHSVSADQTLWAIKTNILLVNQCLYKMWSTSRGPIHSP